MKNLIIILSIITGVLFSQDMIVRVYVPSWQNLKAISEKPLDIAGVHKGKWYDIVADRQILDKIIASGLPYEVKIYSLEYEKEKVRGTYHTYGEVNLILKDMAINYPTICKLDSLPIPTYQGRWLYGVKISDDPNYEDPTEPGLLVDALHHSREWQTIEIVLFFADSMLKSYGVVPPITEIINNTEIYCFPIINADGYVYDYPGALGWRKNREPFEGAIGTDPNRNYRGCSGDLRGDWGAVDSGKVVDHYPDDDVFCGAYANSGDETRALTMFVRSHIINAYMSYHSYSEYLMWGWGWSSQNTPDNALYVQKGNYMAGLVQRLSGGTYTPGQIPEILYSVSGGSTDWIYSYNHYVNGISNLSYVTEADTTFYELESVLDNIVRQNFKALRYLAHFADSIVILCEGRVPPCLIYPLDTVGQDFTIAWHAKNPDDNHPTKWELVELSNPSVIEDNLESGTGRWILQGFTLSTVQSHSPTNSFFSGNTTDMNSAVRTAHPYLVEPGDSVSFWCYYNLEPDYDVAVVEVSENTKEWFNLDTTRFNDTQLSWIRKAYSLANWVGKSIYLRFRSMTDGSINNGGFYVDDIKPVCLFNNLTTISSNIIDTLYAFTNHPLGEYYYYVKGYNTTWAWGDYSCLEKVYVVEISISEGNGKKPKTENPKLAVYPNPSSNRVNIRCMIQDSRFKIQNISLKIYDVAGKLVRDLTNNLASCILNHVSVISWEGNDNSGRKLSPGVYFVQLATENFQQTEKVILLR